MGILARPLEMVRELRLPRGFSVCELGDQVVTASSPHYPARDFYRGLGCGRYASLDGNGRGTHAVDLNRKMDRAEWHSVCDGKPFDLVTDFGTGEHVFDQANVWRVVHNLTRVGGYVAFDRPRAGYDGHGYYLTDEGLFRDLAAANGYDVLRLEREETTRGELVRGVFRRLSRDKFVPPYQTRYVKSSVVL